MNFLEHIAVQEAEEQRVLQEYALQGHFDEAIRGFGSVMYKLYGVPDDIDADIYIPARMALATTYRDRGVTLVRRLLHPEAEAPENDIAFAYQDLDTAYDETAEWVGDIFDREDELNPKLMSVHGLTLAYCARVDAALLAASKRDIVVEGSYEISSDVQAGLSLSVERARKYFDNANEHLWLSNNVDGATSNAVRAALFERGVVGDEIEQSTWLLRAGLYVSRGTNVEADADDHIRANQTLEEGQQALSTQDTAVEYMSNWRTM